MPTRAWYQGPQTRNKGTTENREKNRGHCFQRPRYFYARRNERLLLDQVGLGRIRPVIRLVSQPVIAPARLR